MRMRIQNTMHNQAKCCAPNDEVMPICEHAKLQPNKSQVVPSPGPSYANDGFGSDGDDGGGGGGVMLMMITR